MTTAAPVTVEIKADTTQAVKAIEALTNATDPRRGVKTSEFWVSLLSLPAVLGLLDSVFHSDFAPRVQMTAVILAGVTSAVYTLTRAHLKRPSNLSALGYDLKAILAAATAAKAVEIVPVPAPTVGATP